MIIISTHAQSLQRSKSVCVNLLRLWHCRLCTVSRKASYDQDGTQSPDASAKMVNRTNKPFLPATGTAIAATAVVVAEGEAITDRDLHSPQGVYVGCHWPATLPVHMQRQGARRVKTLS